jgi:hypothetical protein
MKKLFFLIFVMLFFILFTSVAFADGALFLLGDNDMYKLREKNEQFCLMDYYDDRQHMLLTVNSKIPEEETQTFWLFPIPTKAEDARIDIAPKFPQLRGERLDILANNKKYEILQMASMTQIYPIVGEVRSYKTLDYKDNSNIEIFQNVEKYGLTTEVVSASDQDSIKNYLLEKGFNIENVEGINIDEYINKDYSFVISWISNPDEYTVTQGQLENGELKRNGLSVYVDFPTEKLFYPLQLTSIYGDKEIPTHIYILGYQTPQVLTDIQKDTQVNYYIDKQANTSINALSKVFVDKTFMPKDTLRYTKIKINSKSNNFTEDLLIDLKTPVNVKLQDLVVNHYILFTILFISIISIIISVIAGRIVLGKKVSTVKLALLGLLNLLTIGGLATIVYLIGLGISEDHQNNLKSKWIGLIIPVELIFLMVLYYLIDIGDLSLYPVFWAVLGILLVTIVLYGIVFNRKGLKYLLLFSLMFTVFVGLIKFVLGLTHIVPMY